MSSDMIFYDGKKNLIFYDGKKKLMFKKNKNDPSEKISLHCVSAQNRPSIMGLKNFPKELDGSTILDFSLSSVHCFSESKRQSPVYS